MDGMFFDVFSSTKECLFVDGLEAGVNPPQTNQKQKSPAFLQGFSSGATRTLFSLFYLIAKIKRNKK